MSSLAHFLTSMLVSTMALGRHKPLKLPHDRVQPVSAYYVGSMTCGV